MKRFITIVVLLLISATAIAQQRKVQAEIAVMVICTTVYALFYQNKVEN